MRRFLQNFLAILGAGLFLVAVYHLIQTPPRWSDFFRPPTEKRGAAPEVLPPPPDPVVRIVLDPGHGGTDPGSIRGALFEKHLALEVARGVQERLKDPAFLPQENLEIVLTRTGDESLTLMQRVAFANRFFKAYFVSIHFNASVHVEAHGTETFYALPKPVIVKNQIRRRLRLSPSVDLVDGRGLQFAKTVQQHLLEALDSRDRGIRNDPTLVLPREIIGPAILVECGFISNREEAGRIRDKHYRRRIVDGIAAGIRDYVLETGMDPFAGIQKLDSSYEPPRIGPATGPSS